MKPRRNRDGNTGDIHFGVCIARRGRRDYHGWSMRSRRHDVKR
jgi:hypothetical protein